MADKQWAQLLSHDDRIHFMLQINLKCSQFMSSSALVSTEPLMAKRKVQTFGIVSAKCREILIKEDVT